MGRIGLLTVAMAMSVVVVTTATPGNALNCSPCGPAPAPAPRPAPVRSSDYQPINVIGGLKDVFNTHGELPRWDRVRRAMAADQMAADPRMQSWIGWAQGLRDQPPSARLVAINARVNQRLRYVPDRVARGSEDHWQTPLESIAVGSGDCEDYALLKYYLALHAGIGDEDLALVIGRVVSTGELHAVLVARSERGWSLLDNRTNTIVNLGGRVDFTSIYFVDGREIWVPVGRGRAN